MAAQDVVASDVVVHSADSPQEQFQYIATKIDADKAENSPADYVITQSSEIETHIISNYANNPETPHRNRSNAAFSKRASHDSKHDTPCAQCTVYEQQITKLSQKGSDSNRQSEDDDLKDWVLPIENHTMEQALECIGNKQQIIEKSKEKICKLNATLNVIIQEKESLLATNKKLNTMYTIQKHQFETLENKYKSIQHKTGSNEAMLERHITAQEYADAIRSLKQYKQKNHLLQQQIQSQDHSKCHELIKQHYDKYKMYEDKYQKLMKQTNPTHLTQKNHELVHKYNGLLAKYHEIVRKYNENIQAQNTTSTQHVEEKTDHVKCNKIIETLKVDLAHAQRSILEMSNVVGVKQKLPTVQETLSIFHSIRDQQHHNTSSELKKYIKSQHNDWHKYYINQCVHQFMFRVLCECYEAVTLYRAGIFNTIADALNMRFTLKEVFQSADYQKKFDDEQAFIQNEIDRILSNRFGSYFKENYKTILHQQQMVERVRKHVLKQEYAQCLVDINGNMLQSLDEYILQCCDVCWIMILQDPMLYLTPTVWECVQCVEAIMFDDRRHKKVLGSDRNCKQILYYVWPVIARNVDNILDDQKMDVVLREMMYAPYKESKA